MSELIKAMLEQKKKKEEAERVAEEKARQEREEAKKKERDAKELKKQTELKIKTAVEINRSRPNLIKERTPRISSARPGGVSAFTYDLFSFLCPRVERSELMEFFV